MSTISSSTPPLRTTAGSASTASATVANGSPAPSVPAATAVRPDVQISSLASRLNKAENGSGIADPGLSHD